MMEKIISEENLSETKSPLISVALPIYNGERYLAEAIDSILAQTFTDFELIIIDDGSTDSSLDILRVYEKRDARIRLISRENRNLVATLNEIIDLARGTWIARMDQDDIAMPHRFERQLEWLEKSGADICGTWVRFFGAGDERVLKHPQNDDAIKMAMLFGCPFAHPTVMMKADLVRKLRYDNAYEKCEDYDLWERASRAGWLMTNVPEILLLYRQHEGQISTVTSDRQQELTQKVRRSAWENVCDSMCVKIEWVDEVLKLREKSPPKISMDKVERAIISLLEQTQGEARRTIFDQATRLYFRAAADCEDIVARWGRMNNKFGCGFALSVRGKLFFLNILHLTPDGKFFEKLKGIKFYAKKVANNGNSKDSH